MFICKSTVDKLPRRPRKRGLKTEEEIAAPIWIFEKVSIFVYRFFIYFYLSSGHDAYEGFTTRIVQLGGRGCGLGHALFLFSTRLYRIIMYVNHCFKICI